MDKQTRFSIPCLALLLMSLFMPSALYGDSNTYTVQKGDTLYSIARKFDVSLDTLFEVNKISDPTRVPVGTLLKIPGKAAPPATGTPYIVQRGDTLYSLSRRFAVSLDELLNYSFSRPLPPCHSGTELIPGDISLLLSERWKGHRCGRTTRTSDAKEC